MLGDADGGNAVLARWPLERLEVPPERTREQEMPEGFWATVDIAEDRLRS
jgi:hypothetical protein